MSTKDAATESTLLLGMMLLRYMFNLRQKFLWQEYSHTQDPGEGIRLVSAGTVRAEVPNPCPHDGG